MFLTLCHQADAQGRAVSLTSSNPANTVFYTSLGFTEKAKIILGNDNPTWQGLPVVLLIVCKLNLTKLVYLVLTFIRWLGSQLVPWSSRICS